MLASENGKAPTEVIATQGELLLDSTVVPKASRMAAWKGPVSAFERGLVTEETST